jgi:ABC-type polysaccharide/polyol phosphate export permease
VFPVIILIFTSSTIVPVATMPGRMQALAEVNPITVVVDALGTLTLGGPTSAPLLKTIGWIVGLLVVTVTLAIVRHRTAT